MPTTTIVIAFPVSAENVRTALAKYLTQHGIQFQLGACGVVFEELGPSPGVFERTLKIISSRSNIVAICAVLAAASPILEDYFASQSASAIRIETGSGQAIELRGSTDIAGAMRLLEQLQETMQDHDSDQDTTTSGTP